MPGSPATSPKLGAPRFANADAVDFAGQVNGVVDAIDDKAARVDAGTSRPAASIAERFYVDTALGMLSYDTGSAWLELSQRVPLLTPAEFLALPAQPDGTVVRVQLAAPTGSVPGLNVRLRLNKASTHAAKWEVDGDSPELLAETTVASSNAASTTYVTPTSAQSLTLPLGGVVIAHAYSGQFYVAAPAGAASQGYLSYTVGATAAADADAAFLYAAAAALNQVSIRSAPRRKTVAAADTMTPRIRGLSSTTAVYANGAIAGVPYGVSAKYVAVIGPAAI